MFWQDLELPCHLGGPIGTTRLGLCRGVGSGERLRLWTRLAGRHELATGRRSDVDVDGEAAMLTHGGGRREGELGASRRAGYDLIHEALQTDAHGVTAHLSVKNAFLIAIEEH